MPLNCPDFDVTCVCIYEDAHAGLSKVQIRRDMLSTPTSYFAPLMLFLDTFIYLNVFHQVPENLLKTQN